MKLRVLNRDGRLAGNAGQHVQVFIVETVALILGVDLQHASGGGVFHAGCRSQLSRLAADDVAVIVAFGFRPSPDSWLEEQGVNLDSSGRIVAPESRRYPFQTSCEKIFAGGDAVRGADLVVTAIAEGRSAAEAILEYLEV